MVGHDALFGQWAAQQIPHAAIGSFGDFVALGIVDADNIIRGAALYHNYVPDYRSIEITFALESPRYLSKSVIAGIMAYPWKQLGLVRISAITPRSAASARRFLETFGFKREGLARHGFGDFGDAVLYGLTRKDWDRSRFNAGRRLDGQVDPIAAASA